MTVQELIEILQKLPKDAEAVVLGTDGNEATYLLIRNFEGKRVEITGVPEHGMEKTDAMA